jgi:hypothetical protein
VSPKDDEFEGTIFSRRPPFPGGWRRDDIGHYLVVVEGSEPGKRIELDSAAALTIGRDAKQATMVFPDTGISRVHAMVRVVNGRAVVEDSINERDVCRRHARGVPNDAPRRQRHPNGRARPEIRATQP